MAIDKQFIEQFISVTSKAALAASYLVGKNNKIAHSPNLSPSAAILTNKNSSSDLSSLRDLKDGVHKGVDKVVCLKLDSVVIL